MLHHQFTHLTANHVFLSILFKGENDRLFSIGFSHFGHWKVEEENQKVCLYVSKIVKWRCYVARPALSLVLQQSLYVAQKNYDWKRLEVSSLQQNLDSIAHLE